MSNWKVVGSEREEEEGLLTKEDEKAMQEYVRAQKEIQRQKYEPSSGWYIP